MSSLKPIAKVRAETPSPRLIAAIREAEEDIKHGRTYSFDNIDNLHTLRSLPQRLLWQGSEGVRPPFHPSMVAVQ